MISNLFRPEGEASEAAEAAAEKRASEKGAMPAPNEDFLNQLQHNRGMKCLNL